MSRKNLSRLGIILGAPLVALACTGCTSGPFSKKAEPVVIYHIPFYMNQETSKEMLRLEGVVKDARGLKEEEELPIEIRATLYDKADQADGERDRDVSSSGVKKLGYELGNALLDIKSGSYTGPLQEILGKPSN